MYQCIIETDDGLTIVECAPEETALAAAERHGGVLVDPGPYTRFEDAEDALTNLEAELTDDPDADVPEVLEDRGEPDGEAR